MLILFVLGLYVVSGAGRLSIDYAFAADREKIVVTKKTTTGSPDARPAQVSEQPV
jgi:hypothetical protein